MIEFIKPEFMKKYEKHESEMEKIYPNYVEKFRNIDNLLI